MAKVFWITGLSGSGKSFIASEFVRLHKEKSIPVISLDGDVLREVFGNQFGYSKEERLKAAKQYARLCKMLAEQNINVICATISLFHEIHDWNRKNIDDYVEIFISADLDMIKKIDVKKIYDQKLKPVMGIDIEPEFPQKPDFIIENSFDKEANDAVKNIFDSTAN